MSGNKLLRILALSSFVVLAPLAFSQETGSPRQVVPPNVGIPVVTPEAARKAAAQTPEPDKTPPAADSSTAKKSSKDKNSKDNPTTSAPTSKDPAAVRSPYIIGPDDTLYIRVWKNNDFSGAVTVGPDGTISMQLINEVKAAGLTPDQLRDVIAEKLTKYINEPEVNVQVTGVRSRTYIIQGEVNRTGVYPLTKPTTILEALVNGGGFGPFANKKKIYVLRGSQRIYFNWNEVSKGKHMEQNIEIRNGDQIFVP
jgi:polysaccharide export outer membrane protein